MAEAAYRSIGASDAAASVDALPPGLTSGGQCAPASRAVGTGPGVSWPRRVQALIGLADALAVGAAVALGLVIRFGWDPPLVSGLSDGVSTGYMGAGVLIAAAWVVWLSVGQTRAARLLGSGLEEYKQVLLASMRVFSAVAIVAYLAKVDLARLFVAITFPLGVALLLVGRWTIRQWLRRARLDGRFLHRVLVVGGRSSVADLAARLAGAPQAGLAVVGACVPGGPMTGEIDPGTGRSKGSTDPGGDNGPAGHGRDPASAGPVPVFGDLDGVVDAVRRAGADIVAVVPSPDLGADRLRRLAWSLEGCRVDLVVSPALTDVAGPRVHVRPAAGLPLLHVEAPRYEGLAWLIKSVFDRVAAAVGLVILSPLFALVAALVTLDDPGPVFYRQQRVGLGGQRFRLVKFRTMVVGADAMRDGLADRNDGDGPLFKLRDDPRVTRVGRWLRRTSLDELPQLVNVVAGQMSLVGPRPPLPEEVERYADPVHRRLLVKPGITGLWQVSGRSDLSWDESVRLDLYYVENWSLTGDLVILARTVAAVLRGEGAY